MEPDEFLTPDAFDALAEDEQDDYLESVGLALQAAREGNDGERRLSYAEHYLDLAQRTSLRRGEIELAAWNAMWEDPDQFAKTLEELAHSPDANEADRRLLKAGLESIRLMIEHKRDLQGLDETDPREGVD